MGASEATTLAEAAAWSGSEPPTGSGRRRRRQAAEAEARFTKRAALRGEERESRWVFWKGRRRQPAGAAGSRSREAKSQRKEEEVASGRNFERDERGREKPGEKRRFEQQRRGDDGG